MQSADDIFLHVERRSSHSLRGQREPHLESLSEMSGASAPWETQLKIAERSPPLRRRDRGRMTAQSEAKVLRAARLTTTPQRSALLGRVRQRGTAPEAVVQEMLTRLGHTYST